MAFLASTWRTCVNLVGRRGNLHLKTWFQFSAYPPRLVKLYFSHKNHHLKLREKIKIERRGKIKNWASVIFRTLWPTWTDGRGTETTEGGPPTDSDATERTEGGPPAADSSIWSGSPPDGLVGVGGRLRVSCESRFGSAVLTFVASNVIASADRVRVKFKQDTCRPAARFLDPLLLDPYFLKAKKRAPKKRALFRLKKQRALLPKKTALFLG